MGYRGVNAWQNFSSNVVERARAAASNIGVTCQFNTSYELADRAQGGGRKRADVHLDRMAAYLVAMNGDPNKPELSTAPPPTTPTA